MCLPSTLLPSLRFPMCAWPHLSQMPGQKDSRGVSAVKRVKTRLRSVMKEETWNILYVSINGPSLESASVCQIIKTATQSWLTARRRYKCAGHSVRTAVAASTQTVTVESDSDNDEKVNEWGTLIVAVDAYAPPYMGGFSTFFCTFFAKYLYII